MQELPPQTRRALLALAICRFAEPIALTSVSPYLPDMISSFNVPLQNISIWTGITSAIFSLFQCIFAVPWSRLADHIGRKSAIILGTTILALAVVAFGFSTSLTQALAARAIAGFANGDVGVTKTMVAELVPEKHLQPTAFTVLPLVWTMGTIVGPALGGLLTTEGARRLFGPGFFFKDYPWALPNVAIGIMLVGGIVAGMVFMPETLPAGEEAQVYQRVEGDEQETEDDLEKGVGATRTFTREAVLNLMAFFLLAAHSMCFDQLLPVFMHFPVREEAAVSGPLYFFGGLAMGSFEIGVFFAASAISCVIVQFWLYARVARAYGVDFCMRCSTVAFPVVYVLVPFTALPEARWLRGVCLLMLMMTKGWAAVFAFPSSAILVSRCTDDTVVLGTLNGVATSCGALGRALGPALGGLVFTFGVKNGSAVVPWWVLSLAAGLGAVPVFMLGRPEDENEGLEMR